MRRYGKTRKPEIPPRVRYGLAFALTALVLGALVIDNWPKGTEPQCKNLEKARPCFPAKILEGRDSTGIHIVLEEAARPLQLEVDPIFGGGPSNAKSISIFSGYEPTFRRFVADFDRSASKVAERIIAGREGTIETYQLASTSRGDPMWGYRSDTWGDGEIVQCSSYSTWPKSGHCWTYVVVADHAVLKVFLPPEAVPQWREIRDYIVRSTEPLRPGSRR